MASISDVQQHLLPDEDPLNNRRTVHFLNAGACDPYIHTSTKQTLMHTICLCFALIFGIVVGKALNLASEGPGAFPEAMPQVHLESFKTSFNDNTTWLRPPPVHGQPEPVWDALLPLGLGFVKAPDIEFQTPVATVSAMHQLHCLYTLRRIYFAEVTNQQNTTSFDNGVDRDSHVAHCFDYLRQSIFCSADSTLEPYIVSESGFPGTGFPRVCRDYDQLKAWASENRATDLQGFIQTFLRHESR